MRYLFDTNVLNAFTAKIRNEPLQGRIFDALSISAISTVTLAELIFGTSLLPPGRRRTAIEATNQLVVSRVKVLNFDEAAARRYGEERARARQAGYQLPVLDLMIAATALTHDLTVVTDNVKDFRYVDGLRWENWLAESKL